MASAQSSGSITDIFVRIHKAGYPFIAAFAAGAVLLGWIWEPLGWLGALLTLWCVYFFRDPDRITPTREGLVIAPADGVVQLVDEAAPPEELGLGDTPRPRVCIFMNVFNVHVNRVPVDGVIKKLSYRPGKFLNASLDKASVDNERQSLAMTTPDGKDIAFVQIAGLVARRILCDVTEGQTMKAGERFGMIRFGSRVDVYFPEGTAPLVIAGQTSIAGETVLADMTASEPARQGVVRT